VVRLGAMGDVIHALPAVSTLKASYPGSAISWIIDPKWVPLLAGNPAVDQVIPFNRRDMASIRSAVARLRSERLDFAVDLQGLIKSALLVSVSGARRRFGFRWRDAREKPAAIFYTDRIQTASSHVSEKNIELVQAAGATRIDRSTPLPPGVREGALPEGPFVLASPMAGWKSKQWPLEYFAELAKNFPLVVNGAPSDEEQLNRIPGARVHLSGIEGLLYATRQAAAIVGVDSGPMHLAAALGKPGVGIFGPTDPARNGPLGTSMIVLRQQGVETTYRRGTEIAASMRAITPDFVAQQLARLIPG
jgi:heptosyltransferase I